jgi:hypothetical protein
MTDSTTDIRRALERHGAFENVSLDADTKDGCIIFRALVDSVDEDVERFVESRPVSIERTKNIGFATEVELR